MLCVRLNQITHGTQDVNTSISNVSSHIYKLFSYMNITLHSLEKKNAKKENASGTLVD